MQQNTFPKTVRGFYWLVIKHFPWYFGTIFTLGIIGNILNMVFDPLALKWMMQVYENAGWNFYGSVYVFKIGQ